MSEQPPVKMYTLSTCSHCKAVTKLLTRSNLEFEVVDVDRLDGDQRKDMLDWPSITSSVCQKGAEALSSALDAASKRLISS